MFPNMEITEGNIDANFMLLLLYQVPCNGEAKLHSFC